MDTIAVVGAGDRALALLERLAESRFEVVSVSTSPDRLGIELRRRLPVATRATFLAEFRFVSDLAELADCSIVLDAYETADEGHRARALCAIEAHLSPGAVIASPTSEPERIAAALARPTQFVALARIDGMPEAVLLDATAPGAMFAAERLCSVIAPPFPRIARDSVLPAALDLR